MTLLTEKENKWISIKEQIPAKNKDVEISYDGITSEGEAVYLENRTCMLAGYAGGNGYFGEGFATNGSDNTDYGLIIDEPTHWRYKG